MKKINLQVVYSYEHISGNGDGRVNIVATSNDTNESLRLRAEKACYDAIGIDGVKIIIHRMHNIG